MSVKAIATLRSINSLCFVTIWGFYVIPTFWFFILLLCLTQIKTQAFGLFDALFSLFLRQKQAENVHCSDFFFQILLSLHGEFLMTTLNYMSRYQPAGTIFFNLRNYLYRYLMAISWLNGKSFIGQHKCSLLIQNRPLNLRS